MNTSRLGLLVVLLGAAGSALGHHSFRTAYDSTRSTEITGVVAEYVLKSPHSLILLDVTNEDGGVERFEVEMAALAMLRRQGFDEDTFEPGDEITVIAWPHRASNTLVFSRGFITQDGTAPGENATPGDTKSAAREAPGIAKVAGRWLAPFSRAGSETPLPLTPAGLTARENYDPQRSPANICEPTNIPAVFYTPFLFDIRITDQQAVVRHEAYNIIRTVPLDSEPRRAEPSGVFGMVAGRIDGDELVIESSGYPESDWGLGIAAGPNGVGADVPSSSQKKVIERYSVSSDGGTLTVGYTLEDPVYLTEPYSSHIEFTWVPDDEPMHEYDCELDSAARFSRGL